MQTFTFRLSSLTLPDIVLDIEAEDYDTALDEVEAIRNRDFPDMTICTE